MPVRAELATRFSNQIILNSVLLNIPKEALAMWEFHASGGAPRYSWTWAWYGGKPFSQRRSAAAYLSYHDVIADATRNGFNIVTDRWRIITPSDGIPSYDEKLPVARPSVPVPPPVVREAKSRGRRTVAVELVT